MREWAYEDFVAAEPWEETYALPTSARYLLDTGVVRLCLFITLSFLLSFFPSFSLVVFLPVSTGSTKVMAWFLKSWSVYSATNWENSSQFLDLRKGETLLPELRLGRRIFNA